MKPFLAQLRNTPAGDMQIDEENENEFNKTCLSVEVLEATSKLADWVFQVHHLVQFDIIWKKMI